MSSEGFRKILENGQCRRRRSTPAVAEREQHQIDWQFREMQVKEYLMTTALDGTRSGNVVNRLRASLVGGGRGLPEFDRCKWHQLLYRIGDRPVASRGDVVEEMDADMPEPLALAPLMQIYDVGEGPWLRANPDIDTLEIFTNRLDVFNVVCISPTETFEYVSPLFYLFLFSVHGLPEKMGLLRLF